MTSADNQRRPAVRVRLRVTASLSKAYPPDGEGKVWWALAGKTHLPAMFGPREDAAAGGLLAYGPKYAELYRRESGAICCGVGGAKGGDQGECGQQSTRQTQSRISVSQALDRIRLIIVRKVGAVCGKAASTNLRGEREAIRVPTATDAAVHESAYGR
jgi:hypothetical protein